MTRRLLIGTPSYNGQVEAEYAHSLAGTARIMVQYGVDMRDIILWGSALIQDARNDIVKIAIEHDFDDLIMIDSDQDWEPEWIARLLRYPVDCVGVPVRKKTDEEVYNIKAKSCDIPVCPKTGLLLVDGVGCGMIRFSRRALQVLWDTAEPYAAFEGKRSRWIFDVRPIGGELVGEDAMIWRKLADNGVQTYLDPTMTCGHIGRKRYHGDFAKWLKAQQAMRKAAAE